jgi:hypothetical protein
MNWISQTVRALLPSCREAIRLQSDALDQPLSPVQRTGLRIHLWLCKWCRRYGRQIRFLRAAARAHPDQLCRHEPHGLPPEARERLKRALSRNRANGI